MGRVTFTSQGQHDPPQALESPATMPGREVWTESHSHLSLLLTSQGSRFSDICKKATGPSALGGLFTAVALGPSWPLCTELELLLMKSSQLLCPEGAGEKPDVQMRCPSSKAAAS